MIIFNIVLDNEEKAGTISAFLIQQKFALQTHIDTNKILTSDGQKQTIRLFFITKSLLYDIIEKEIKKLFYTPEMIIYASPVSHINEEFGELLRANIKAV
jgi:hypothetical protein